MDTDPGHQPDQPLGQHLGNQPDQQVGQQVGQQLGQQVGQQFGLAGYSASTYGDSFADVYDEWYGSLNDDDFVASIVRDLPATPVRVLELGVGTGRLIAQFLAARTTTAPNVADTITDTIIGVDSSAAMIARAADRHFPAHVTLTTCDFTTALPDGPFDVIFVGYNTLFNVADAHALQSCLALVADRLAPDGQFIVDVVHPTNDDDADHVSVRHMTTTEVVLSVSSHDPDGQRITGQFIQFTHGATVQLRPWSVRYFSPSQLDAIATAAGLRLVSRHSNGAGAAFTDSSRRHISRYSK